MSNDFLSLDSHSRRSFVERCARAAFGLSILPFLEGARSFGIDTAQTSAMSPSRPGFGSAKRVIFLQLTGGMSHIDTFDPKTGASKSPKGAISTKAGYQLTEFLPKTAAISDKICVVRSMTAKVGVHAAAQYFIRTGFEQRGTIKHPTLGAWAQHYLGPSHKTLPSSVCVNRSSDHGNGFFPATYSPLPILDPDAGLQNSVAAAGNEVVEKRLTLVNEIDRNFRERFPDENVKAYNDFYDNTVQLMKSSDLKAFDLNAEPANLREAYGKSKFGQGCLLARRLVESGVRFIEVVSGGWDMHTGLTERMTEVGGEFDQAFAALIGDLDSRGLLKDTLVVVATEFGRKPDFSGNGRGHYPKVFSTVLAGAGIKRGYVHGASDDLGAEPTDKDMTVGSFHATIAWAAGLPIEQAVVAPNGRPFTIGNKGVPAPEVFA
jgi:Protein of unknown function (DUF1501)